MRLLWVFVLLLLSWDLHAQVAISGRVQDNKGRPIAGASIAIKNSYDGSTSDSTGHFHFRTSEKGEQILLTTSIGFRLAEQKINLDHSSLQLDITLKEEPSELKAVVVSAGTFEASDTK